MTVTDIEKLTARLADKLNIDFGRIHDALKEIVREDVLKIARNTPEGENEDTAEYNN